MHFIKYLTKKYKKLGLCLQKSETDTPSRVVAHFHLIIAHLTNILQALLTPLPDGEDVEMDETLCLTSASQWPTRGA